MEAHGLGRSTSASPGSARPGPPAQAPGPAEPEPSAADVGTTEINWQGLEGGGKKEESKWGEKFLNWREIMYGRVKSRRGRGNLFGGIFFLPGKGNLSFTSYY